MSQSIEPSELSPNLADTFEPRPDANNPFLVCLLEQTLGEGMTFPELLTLMRWRRRGMPPDWVPGVAKLAQEMGFAVALPPPRRQRKAKIIAFVPRLEDPAAETPLAPSWPIPEPVTPTPIEHRPPAPWHLGEDHYEQD